MKKKQKIEEEKNNETQELKNKLELKIQIKNF